MSGDRGPGPEVVVIDVGLGNLRSVERAVARAGGRPRLSAGTDDVARADVAVFPGQGAFGDAMRALAGAGLLAPLRARIGAGRPYLGICLGLQILFERSEEAPGVAGLGVLPGEVARFSPNPGRKVPHVGWNAVRSAGVAGAALLGAGATYFYFTHSYYPRPATPDCVAGWTEYDGETFACAAALAGGKVAAVQFHPEKSQDAGAAFLRTFLAHACA
ncbi:MAG TPA: imidazole glycerol phosphate synthase subunit HisH [Myxococcota bacterium]|jgi:imidazole glycerol phosphate synthase glutamine amidotransferase subunit|nr:imidazole glycerol phosphate synthase subunit HisH [Myxococcota bacterium]